MDKALDDFNPYPLGAPFIPDWRRIEVAINGIMEELAAALENDAEWTFIQHLTASIGNEWAPKS